MREGTTISLGRAIVCTIADVCMYLHRANPAADAYSARVIIIVCIYSLVRRERERKITKEEKNNKQLSESLGGHSQSEHAC